MEKLKDIFHDFSDILLAITVTAIMFFVFSTSLGSWFHNSPNTVLANEKDNSIESNMDSNEAEDNNQDINNNIQVENPPDTDLLDEIVDNRDDDQDLEDNKEDLDSDIVPDSNDTQLESNDRESGFKKIIVPNGTPSSGIAKILKDNGLIEDTNIFIQASESLNLSVRLKSGTFQIPSDSSVEDMVKIIAGQKK